MWENFFLHEQPQPIEMAPRPSVGSSIAFASTSRWTHWQLTPLRQDKLPQTFWRVCRANESAGPTEGAWLRRYEWKLKKKRHQCSVTRVVPGFSIVEGSFHCSGSPESRIHLNHLINGIMIRTWKVSSLIHTSWILYSNQISEQVIQIEQSL